MQRGLCTIASYETVVLISEVETSKAFILIQPYPFKLNTNTGEYMVSDYRSPCTGFLVDSSNIKIIVDDVTTSLSQKDI